MKKLITIFILAFFMMACNTDDDSGRNCSCDIIINIQDMGENTFDLFTLQNECTLNEYTLYVDNQHFVVGDCVRF